MKPFRLTFFALLLMSACGGNPFLVDDGTPDDGGTTDSGGITTDGGLPPGTSTPTANRSITRYEPKGKDTTNGDSGNGYVKKVEYISEENGVPVDKFKVDNLGFSGNNVFGRGEVVGSLGPYAVYEGKPTQPDSVTGTPIEQLQHRAIYGVSENGDVKFAIVRTGSYVDYGFGGFIYSRAGGVTLPKEGVGTDDPENPGYRGQAHFEGDMAGLRDFKGRGGLEYSTGKMSVDIDFDDFNDGNAVKGTVYDRHIFDINGDDITQDVLDGLTEESGLTQGALPTLLFTIGPGVMNDNGEIVGFLSSYYDTDSGGVTRFEAGKYYALVSGAAGDQQIVGVFVVEGSDPRWDNVTTRETSGFILTRQ